MAPTAAPSSGDVGQVLSSELAAETSYQETADGGTIYNYNDGTSVLIDYDPDGNLRIIRPNGTYVEFSGDYYEDSNGDVGSEITILAKSTQAHTVAQPPAQLAAKIARKILTSSRHADGLSPCMAGRDVWVATGAAIGAWAGGQAGGKIDGAIGGEIGLVAGGAAGSIVDPLGGGIFGGAVGYAVGYAIGDAIGEKLGGSIGAIGGSGIGGWAYDQMCGGGD